MTQVSAAFLALVFRSDYGLGWLERHAAGTTFKEVKLTDLRRMPIPLPDLTSQVVIVERLAAIAVAEVRVGARLDALTTLVTRLLNGVLSS